MEKRNTCQKKAIRKKLAQMHNHPTASMVAEELAREGSPASRATVFRVLSDMADEGLIRRVNLMNNDMRYDDNPKPHYHFQCRVCGRIEDVSLPFMEELNTWASENGNIVETHDIQFVGVCAACRKKARNLLPPSGESVADKKRRCPASSPKDDTSGHGTVAI